MPSPGETEIAVVTGTDLPDLLPLMRAYCHFYAVDPTDAQLERLVRALVDDPAHEGVQLLRSTRHPGGRLRHLLLDLGDHPWEPGCGDERPVRG